MNRRLIKHIKFYRNIRFPGGAINYVIFLSFVLCAFLYLYLSFREAEKRFVQNESIYSQKLMDVDSYITAYLSGLVNFNDSLDDMVAKEMAESNVKLQRSFWGIYTKLVAETYFKKTLINKTILAGTHPGKTDSVAFWIPEMGQTLYASGETRIIGNTYLPKNGIQKAAVEGNIFKGKYVVQGLTFRSTGNLPPLSAELIERIQFWQNIDSLKNSSLNISSLFSASDGSPDVNYSYYSEKSYQISRINLKGFYVLLSKGNIHLNGDFKPEGIIITSKNVRIEDNFKGSVQIFARDSIIIGKNCILEYPSALITGCMDGCNSYIELGSESRIFGNIITYSGKPASQSRLVIKDKALITGQVYFPGTVDFNGKIFGSLYCIGFYHKTLRSYFENHLVDAEVDFYKLPTWFGGADLFGKGENRIICNVH